MQAPDDVRAELAAREPCLHRPEPGATRADLERLLEPEFCEIGASGRLYTRAEALDVLERRAREPAPAESWSARDFACLALAPDTYLLRYVLAQGARTTRRTTIWRRRSGAFRVVFHQGTPATEAGALTPESAPAT